MVNLCIHVYVIKNFPLPGEQNYVKDCLINSFLSFNYTQRRKYTHIFIFVPLQIIVIKQQPGWEIDDG